MSSTASLCVKQGPGTGLNWCQKCKSCRFVPAWIRNATSFRSIWSNVACWLYVSFIFIQKKMVDVEGVFITRTQAKPARPTS